MAYLIVGGSCLLIGVIVTFILCRLYDAKLDKLQATIEGKIKS